MFYILLFSKEYFSICFNIWLFLLSENKVINGRDQDLINFILVDILDLWIKILELMHLKQLEDGDKKNIVIYSNMLVLVLLLLWVHILSISINKNNIVNKLLNHLCI